MGGGKKKKEARSIKNAKKKACTKKSQFEEASTSYDVKEEMQSESDKPLSHKERRLLAKKLKKENRTEGCSAEELSKSENCSDLKVTDFDSIRTSGFSTEEGDLPISHEITDKDNTSLLKQQNEEHYETGDINVEIKPKHTQMDLLNHEASGKDSGKNFDETQDKSLRLETSNLELGDQFEMNDRTVEVNSEVATDYSEGYTQSDLESSLKREEEIQALTETYASHMIIQNESEGEQYFFPQSNEDVSHKTWTFQQKIQHENLCYIKIQCSQNNANFLNVPFPFAAFQNLGESNEQFLPYMHVQNFEHLSCGIASGDLLNISVEKEITSRVISYSRERTKNSARDLEEPLRPPLDDDIWKILAEDDTVVISDCLHQSNNPICVICGITESQCEEGNKGYWLSRQKMCKVKEQRSKNEPGRAEHRKRINIRFKDFVESLEVIFGIKGGTGQNSTSGWKLAQEEESFYVHDSEMGDCSDDSSTGIEEPRYTIKRHTKRKQPEAENEDKSTDEENVKIEKRIPKKHRKTHYQTVVQAHRKDSSTEDDVIVLSESNDETEYISVYQKDEICSENWDMDGSQMKDTAEGNDETKYISVYQKDEICSENWDTDENQMKENDENGEHTKYSAVCQKYTELSEIGDDEMSSTKEAMRDSYEQINHDLECCHDDSWHSLLIEIEMMFLKDPDNMLKGVLNTENSDICEHCLKCISLSVLTKQFYKDVGLLKTESVVSCDGEIFEHVFDYRDPANVNNPIIGNIMHRLRSIWHKNCIKKEEFLYAKEKLRTLYKLTIESCIERAKFLHELKELKIICCQTCSWRTSKCVYVPRLLAVCGSCINILLPSELLDRRRLVCSTQVPLKAILSSKRDKELKLRKDRKLNPNATEWVPGQYYILRESSSEEDEMEPGKVHHMEVLLALKHHPASNRIVFNFPELTDIMKKPPCAYEQPSPENRNMGIVKRNAIMCLKLNKCTFADMTLNGTLRLAIEKCGVAVAAKKDGSQIAVIHPACYIFKQGNLIDIKVVDRFKNHKFGQIGPHGVSFTTVECQKTYVLNGDEVRDTVFSFMNVEHDFTCDLIAGDQRVGDRYIPEAVKALQESSYWLSAEPQLSENWKIQNNIIHFLSSGGVHFEVGETMGLVTRNNILLICEDFKCCIYPGIIIINKGPAALVCDNFGFYVRQYNYVAGINLRNALHIPNQFLKPKYCENKE